MPPLDPVVLRGQHVTLEPLRADHAPGLQAAADAARATFALTLVPADLAAMRAYVAGLHADHAAGRALPFAVRDRDGVLVGCTRFLDVERWTWPGGHPAAPPVPAGPDVVEIGGTWYAERVQRTALNTEAKLLLCTHAFERWGVRRVRWKTDARNTRSRAAILRLGARFEGVIRAARPGFDGAVRDDAMYSLLASEWPEAKQALTALMAPRGP